MFTLWVLSVAQLVQRKTVERLKINEIKVWKEAIVPGIWKDWLTQQKLKFEKSVSFLGTIQRRE